MSGILSVCLQNLLHGCESEVREVNFSLYKFLRDRCILSLNLF